MEAVAEPSEAGREPRDQGLGAAEFAFFRAWLRGKSGIALAEDKRYLAQARLGALARRPGCGSLSELVARLAADEDPALATEVVERMTTHETLFFRDGAPFDALRDVMLPALATGRARSGPIRIWSAACSTGQEPYSLAMLIEELATPPAGPRVEILASDLSAAAVAQASDGRFNQFEVQRGLSIHRLLSHFEQEGTNWRIARRLRERVAFRTVNLIADFSDLGRFDVVFCRNALLYFDDATRADVLRRLASQIFDGGYLVIGATESLAGRTTSFNPVADRPGVFVKSWPKAPAARR